MDKPIESHVKLDNGSILTYRAENIREAYSGTHAKIKILLDGKTLAYSVFNVDRSEERIKLSNAAHSKLGTMAEDIVWKSALRHELDLFAENLWAAFIDSQPAEEVGGDAMLPLNWMAHPHVLEKGGTLIFGDPGKGKSTTAMILAVAVNSGLNGLWKTKQAKVMYINLERSKDSLKRRLGCVNTALGLDPGSPLLMYNSRGRSLASVLPVARRTVEKMGVELVILDSISRAGVGDLNENQPTNDTMDQLNEMCPSWVGIGHTGHSDKTRMFGSQFWMAGADVGVKLQAEQRENELGVRLEVTKGNDFSPPAPMVLRYIFDEFGLSRVDPAKTSDFPELQAQRKRSHLQELEDLLERRNMTETQIYQAMPDVKASELRGLLHDNRDRFTRTGDSWGLRRSYSSLPPAGEP